MRRVTALSVALILASALSTVQAGPLTHSLYPQPRPGSARAAEPTLAQPNTRSALAPILSLRPQARANAERNPTEDEVVQVSTPIIRATTPSRDRRGSVCQNPAIEGTRLEPIKGRLKGCSIAEPVLVTSVQGVVLHPAATLNCAAANALSQWVEEGLQPAFRGQIVQLNVADSYSCRPRNNVPGNKVSEHGAGNAIDLSAFVLRNGKIMTVEDNYGRQIIRAQKAACGTFTTTLGPGSDGYHENHIHLDVSRHGGGPYCR